MSRLKKRADVGVGLPQVARVSGLDADAMLAVADGREHVLDHPGLRLYPVDHPGRRHGDPGWPERTEATRGLGDDWLTKRSAALLTVPSAIVPRTFNVLLTPSNMLVFLYGSPVHVAFVRIAQALGARLRSILLEFLYAHRLRKGR